MIRSLRPLLLVLFVPATPASAQVGDGSLATLWRNPVFRGQMLGTFGINPDVEPPLSVEQGEAWDQIAPLVANNPANAIKLLNQALAVEKLGKDKGSALFEFTLGNIYYLNNRPREAAFYFQRAIAKFPSFRRAHQNLGVIFAQGGQAKLAIEHFTKAIQLGAVDGSLYGLLGSVYSKNEQHVPAEIAYRNALILTPEVREWKLGLLQSVLAQNKYEEAIALTSAMIAEKPDDPVLWQIQASAHVGKKDFKEAAADFEMLDLLGQSTAESLNTMGDIYANEGALSLAADSYLRSFEKKPGATIDGPLRAAEILVARDGATEARRLLDRLVAERGSTFDKGQLLQIKRVQAKIFRSENKDDESAKLLREIVDADPLDGDALILLGQYFAKTDQNELAATYYERAGNIAEFEADAKVRHGQLLVSMGKYADALPLLRRGHELKPRDSVAKFIEDLERYLKGRK